MPIVQQWFFIKNEESDTLRTCTVYNDQKRNRAYIVKLQCEIYGQKYIDDFDERQLIVKYVEICKSEQNLSGVTEEAE